jgi:hypothetical protein
LTIIILINSDSISAQESATEIDTPPPPPSKEVSLDLIDSFITPLAHTPPISTTQDSQNSAYRNNTQNDVRGEEIEDKFVVRRRVEQIMFQLRGFEQRLGQYEARVSENLGQLEKRLLQIEDTSSNQFSAQNRIIDSRLEQLTQDATNLDEQIKRVDGNVSTVDERLEKLAFASIAVATTFLLFVALYLATKGWPKEAFDTSVYKKKSIGPAKVVIGPPKISQMELPSCDRKAVGAVSRTGFVRKNNEDRAVALSVNGRHAVIVADGMGGLSNGGYAAEVAVHAAAERFIELCSVAPPENADSATWAAVAISAAQKAVMDEVARDPKLAEGFRTTLIVGILDGSCLGVAWLGDGGACLCSSDGTIQQLVRPMKTEPGSNAIYGSLGPILDGRPKCVSARVRAGDLALFGTDGALDLDWNKNDFRSVKAAELGAAVAEAIKEFRGDVTEALSAIVDDLAIQRDGEMYIIDDNLTLGAIVVPATVFGRQANGQVKETIALDAS